MKKPKHKASVEGAVGDVARLISETTIETPKRRVAEITVTDVQAVEVVSKPSIAIAPTVEKTEVIEPAKPAMSPDAAVYPKLQRIKTELDKQKEIIFEAEHERNLLEIELDDLRGITRLTKKRELDSKIDQKNEKIDILKSGLFGIVRRYGYDTVQQFYKAIKIAQDAMYRYKVDVAGWEENCGAQKKETFEERLRIYQIEADKKHTQRTYHTRDKGAR